MLLVPSLVHLLLGTLNIVGISIDLTVTGQPNLLDMTSPASHHPTLPTRSPLDVVNYPVAPQDLELEQVHVYVRHGERTPVSVRMSDPPASIPAHWIMCKMASRFRATVARFEGEAEEALPGGVKKDLMPVSKVVERIDGSHVEGECLLGELTDLGKETTSNFGKALRSLYVERLGFLPDTLKDYSETYFRSTNMPRTIESLAQVMHGLYPPSKLGPDVSPKFFIRNGRDENLVANTFMCKRLETLLIGFERAAAAALNHTLEPLDQKLSKYINGNPIRIDGQPRLSGIFDTIRASQSHGIKVPPEFEDKGTIDLIERALMVEWFSNKTEEVRRLGMGRLLDDLGKKMAHKAENGPNDPLKILVHSTHDTGIAPLLNTLDVFDERWPQFTAAVTFELFKKKAASSSRAGFLRHLVGWVSAPFAWGAKTPEEHFVRVRYQNRTLPLPACADDGKHLAGSPEFCTLSAFLTRVKEISPKNWEAECMPSPASGQQGRT